MRDIAATGTWRVKAALLVAICGASALSVGGTALANHSIDVNFNTDSHNFYPSPTSNSYAYGHVEPGPTPCRRGRDFKLYKDSGPRILVDSGHSSANGFFALGGDLFGTDEILIRMASKKFGPRERRHTCEADTNTFYLSRTG